MSDTCQHCTSLEIGDAAVAVSEMGKTSYISLGVVYKGPARSYMINTPGGDRQVRNGEVIIVETPDEVATLLKISPHFKLVELVMQGLGRLTQFKSGAHAFNLLSVDGNTFTCEMVRPATDEETQWLQVVEDYLMEYGEVPPTSSKRPGALVNKGYDDSTLRMLKGKPYGGELILIGHGDRDRQWAPSAKGE